MPLALALLLGSVCPVVKANLDGEALEIEVRSGNITFGVEPGKDGQIDFGFDRGKGSSVAVSLSLKHLAVQRSDGRRSVVQTFPETLAALGEDEVEIVVKMDPGNWYVYTDGRPAARLSIHSHSRSAGVWAWAGAFRDV